jgi:hypothetical protein
VKLIVEVRVPLPADTFAYVLAAVRSMFANLKLPEPEVGIHYGVNTVTFTAEGAE